MKRQAHKRRYYEKVYIGVWANIRKDWLKANDYDRYVYLLERNELEGYLQRYQAVYELQAKKLHEKLAKARHVDDTLLEHNFAEWIIQTERIQEEVRATLKSSICQ